VGPTRPWNEKDSLGNPLYLTRSYPYSTAGTLYDIYKFNITLQHDFVLYVNNQTDLLVTNSTDHIVWNMTQSIIQNLTNVLNVVTNVTFDLKHISDSFHDVKVDHLIIMKSLTMEIAAEAVVETGSKITKNMLFENINESFNDIITGSTETNTRIRTSEILKSRRIHTEEPNPYSEFCELGCAYYYASQSNPFHLSECLDKCDDFYSYNVTIGYIDAIEVARLECRDGCHMALMRCKPGYYCSQVQLNMNQPNEEEGYQGGWMRRCPPGTYRDVSYDAVENCVPCPPGRFREESTGKRLESCFKCPPGTYNEKNGSSTIQDCKRCPEGTFTKEEGSGSCICITPFSCHY